MGKVKTPWGYKGESEKCGKKSMPGRKIKVLEIMMKMPSCARANTTVG